MSHSVPSLPSTFASQVLFSTYYLALVDDYDPVKSGMTAFETAEMNAALALVPRSGTTKLFAVNSGNWNTAGNWYPSGVPGANAKVCIPEGCACTYNKSDSSTKLFTLRVDGTLKGDISMSTAMLFDTMVITQLGNFIDGTRTAPVPQTYTHEWIIATSNGLVDVSWDTFFQSRGVISLGHTDLWGAPKTEFLEVATRTAPDTGATSLALAFAPTNWIVGDEIVIGATRYDGASWNGFTTVYGPLQNEKRTLTSSSGVNLGWSGGLTYSHVAPPTSLGNPLVPRAFVANLTRNIVFRPDDANSPIHHRGHTMQMHNPAGWSARNVEFRNLGRTAKHGGYQSRIVSSNAGALANAALPLSGSAFWNGSAISFGPTFLIRMTFTATGSGAITITGTDEDGNSQVETVNYASGFSSEIRNTKYFLTITEIKFSTAFASTLPRIEIEARARQMNENGVRDLQTGSAVYTTIKNTVNLQGRYPFHWHKMGVLGAILLDPPVLDGCSIHRSPGWGVSQHQTHGIIKNCVTYDCRGAGFVGEDGNETGMWQDDISIHCIGIDDGPNKDAYDLINKDPARVGLGFGYTGRMIHVSGCIGIGMPLAHAFNARLSPISVLPAQLDQPTSVRGLTAVSTEEIPLGHFSDNQGIACYGGHDVIKAGPEQQYDLRTPIKRFKSWSCGTGINITYTSHYSMIDCVSLVGYVDGGLYPYFTAQALYVNSSDQAFVNSILDGAAYGIDLHHTATNAPFTTDPLNGRFVVNPTFLNCTNQYNDFNGSIDTIYATGDLNSDPMTLTGLTIAGGYLTGTKHDELGDTPFPFGQDAFPINYTRLLAAYGYYVDGANKYVMTDEWFSSRLTGVMDKVIFPVDVTGQSLGAYTNHGATNLSNNTPPVFSDFSVSVTRNTNKTVNLLALASGNSIRFGGFQRPMKTNLINNGDGTITLVPLIDENYTESCYIWIDDVNGNTTRALMTINVNGRRYRLTTS